MSERAETVKAIIPILIALKRQMKKARKVGVSPEGLINGLLARGRRELKEHKK
jgi:hypothetical protein